MNIYPQNAQRLSLHFELNLYMVQLNLQHYMAKLIFFSKYVEGNVLESNRHLI